MPPTRSWANLTVKQAAAVLAERAVALRRTKRAAGFDPQAISGWLNRQWQENPYFRRGLQGAALGGVGGLGLGLLRRDSDRTHPFGTALTGALAGAGIGAGIEGLKQHYGQINTDTPGEAPWYARAADTVARAPKQLADWTMRHTVGNAISDAGQAVVKTVAQPAVNHPVAALAGVPIAWEGQKKLRSMAARRYGKINDLDMFAKALDRYATADNPAYPFGARGQRAIQNVARLPKSELQAWLDMLRGKTTIAPPSMAAAGRDQAFQAAQSQIAGGGSWEGLNPKTVDDLYRAEIAAREAAGQPVRTPWWKARSYVPGLEQEALVTQEARPWLRKAKWGLKGLLPLLFLSHAYDQSHPQ